MTDKENIKQITNAVILSAQTTTGITAQSPPPEDELITGILPADILDAKISFSIISIPPEKNKDDTNETKP